MSCFSIISGSSTTSKWRNTRDKRFRKASRTSRIYESVATLKSTGFLTFTTTVITTLRYGVLRCATRTRTRCILFYFSSNIVSRIDTKKRRACISLLQRFRISYELSVDWFYKITLSVLIYLSYVLSNISRASLWFTIIVIVFARFV